MQGRRRRRLAVAAVLCAGAGTAVGAPGRAEPPAGGSGSPNVVLAQAVLVDAVPATGGDDAVRSAYATLVEAGGDWDVPVGVRAAMDDGDTAGALEAIAAATVVVASRDDATRKATDLGLTLPAGAEQAYEQAGASGDTLGDLAAVSAVLDEQHLALATLFEIDGARADAEEQLVALGLAVDLAPQLAPARSAFEAGELDDVYDLADEEATEVAAWLDAGAVLHATAARADEPRGLLERVGLLGAGVDSTVRDARVAFTGGDRVRAVELADDAQRALEDARSDGIRRAVGGAVVLAGAAVATTLVLRRRARR